MMAKHIDIIVDIVNLRVIILVVMYCIVVHSTILYVIEPHYSNEGLGHLCNMGGGKQHFSDMFYNR